MSGIIDEQIREDLHQLMTCKHGARELRLLNVGTDHNGECHWRFRTSSGKIVVLKIEIEPDGR
jgi:hypothetical protein